MLAWMGVAVVMMRYDGVSGFAVRQACMDDDGPVNL
jgi:hypothetical protein